MVLREEKIAKRLCVLQNSRYLFGESSKFYSTIFGHQETHRNKIHKTGFDSDEFMKNVYYLILNYYCVRAIIIKMLYTPLK